MSFTLNPFKMAARIIKAPFSMVGAAVALPFKMFKDFITLHPIEMLKEPFRTIETEFKNIGTIMSAGMYTADK